MDKWELIDPIVNYERAEEARDLLLERFPQSVVEIVSNSGQWYVTVSNTAGARDDYHLPTHLSSVVVQVRS